MTLADNAGVTAALEANMDNTEISKLRRSCRNCWTFGSGGHPASTVVVTVGRRYTCRLMHAAHENGSATVLLAINDWCIGFAYRNPADHTGRVLGDLAGALSTLPEGFKWAIAGDFNQKADETTLPEAFGAALHAPLDEEDAYIPSRWDGNSAIDWVLTREQAVLEVGFLPDRFGDHTALKVLLAQEGPGTGGIGSSPQRTSRPLQMRPGPTTRKRCRRSGTAPTRHIPRSGRIATLPRRPRPTSMKCGPSSAGTSRML